LLRLPIYSNAYSGTVTGYGSLRLDILGHVEVKIKLTSEVVYKCKLQVMKNNQIPLLLGCDFMKAAGIVLSMDKDIMLTKYEKEIPY